MSVRLADSAVVYAPGGQFVVAEVDHAVVDAGTAGRGIFQQIIYRFLLPEKTYIAKGLGMELMRRRLRLGARRR